MPDADIGPSVSRGDVANALRDTLKRWIPAYLAAIDEERGFERGTTTPPLDYITRGDLRLWPEEAAPCLLVVVGTAADFELHDGAHGSYAATWTANIGVTVGGANETGSEELADRHLLAVRYVIAQQGSLGGLAEATYLRGEDAGPVAGKRTLLATETIAAVRVRRIVDTRGPLPAVPPENPTDPFPGTPTPSGHRMTVRARLHPEDEE